MAKKNAREEPPKPQVSENEQMSDIVFILDKMELILEAVSQIGQDGKFNTVAADRQNRNSFLKIDRYAVREVQMTGFWNTRQHCIHPVPQFRPPDFHTKTER